MSERKNDLGLKENMEKYELRRKYIKLFNIFLKLFIFCFIFMLIVIISFIIITSFDILHDWRVEVNVLSIFTKLILLIISVFLMIIVFRLKMSLEKELDSDQNHIELNK